MVWRCLLSGNQVQKDILFFIILMTKRDMKKLKAEKPQSEKKYSAEKQFKKFQTQFIKEVSWILLHYYICNRYLNCIAITFKQICRQRPNSAHLIFYIFIFHMVSLHLKINFSVLLHFRHDIYLLFLPLRVICNLHAVATYMWQMMSSKNSLL